MSITADTDFLMRWRMLKDHIARHAVGIGGISVIIAIVLIFVYLLYVVIPMFEGAEIREVATYTLADQDEALYYAMEEQAEVGLQVGKQGKVLFFKTESGATIREVPLPIPAGVIVTSLAEADPASGILAVGLSNGQALIFKHAYRISYPNDQRLISPVIEYPFGETPLVVDEQDLPLLQLAAQAEEEQVTLVALTPDRRIILSHQAIQESLFEDEASWQTTRAEVPHPLEPVTHLLLDKQQRDLFIGTQSGDVSFYDVSDREEGPALIQHLSLVNSQTLMTSLSFLTGDISLLVGTSDGRVSQWFPVRDEGGKRVLTKIREFDDFSMPVNSIAPEHSRKGFVAVDTNGQVGIFHSTAHRTLLVEPVSEQAINRIALGPRADAMLLQDNEQLHFYHIRNEYPEISWSSLWGKVWYESYPEPDFIWQSSSASNDFEPKLSLIPISFGTLKAAFYAMLIAVPLSIMGAIFTAHFMSPRMRQTVKPTIEIMEALPTVILGFLAGLWLAPYIENHLPGIFTLLFILPFGIFFAAWSWHMLPASIRHRVPEGWEAALLLPVVILLVLFSMELSPVLESAFFGGDIRIWMSQELGIDYDQRNSVVVGLAMGFAVIPTIFSITEDAIFAVPKHLVQGSLALGATPWQTMMRVVILTASPGIFSAVMIGLGRAVGETMIVLMATGNTPVMDLSIFQGMRTLSANIAVEMPESEVGSTHYRVLFLAALVLFGFTFIVNTAAEIVRQRLRKRYSSL
jgi:phosphate transport system permease protein